METTDAIGLLWNIVGVIVVLSISCIVAYAWGVGDGYKRGIETGKIQIAKLMHDTLHDLKEVTDGRNHIAERRESHSSKDKRHHSKRRL